MNSKSYYYRGKGFFWIIMLHIVALLLFRLGGAFGATSETNKLYHFLNEEIWYIFGFFEPIFYFFCWLIDDIDESSSKNQTNEKTNPNQES